MTSAGSMSGVNCRRWKRACGSSRRASDGERLGQARHAFEQDVAVGQQADDQPLDQVVLADDRLLTSPTIWSRNWLSAAMRSPLTAGDAVSFTTENVAGRPVLAEHCAGHYVAGS